MKLFRISVTGVWTSRSDPSEDQMARTKNWVGSQAIRDYQHDMETGVPQHLVERHAEQRIVQLRKIDSFAANTAAAQIEQWLNVLVNG
jgi:hypothetical protein